MSITIDKRDDIVNDGIQIESSDGSTRISSTGTRLDTKSDPVDVNALFCLFADILKELREIKLHMQVISDVEPIDGDGEDF